MKKLRILPWLSPLRMLLLLCITALSFFISVPVAGAETTVSSLISTDTTWTVSGSPYIISASLTVVGTDGADGVTTLTIEPGVEVRFNRYQWMRIGDAFGSPGALVAQGTASQPIVFTSNEATPASGDWYFIRFRNTSRDDICVMENCTIEYGGYQNGAIYIESAAPTITQSTVTSSGKYDLFYSGTVGGTVSNCTFNSGISLLTTEVPEFVGNTFNQNNAYPIKTYADNVGALVNGNTFSNLDANSHLFVDSGNLTQDATWPDAIPLYLNNHLTVQGNDGGDAVTTLTLDPGAQLRFNTYRVMNIGASYGLPGALVARGTASNPVLFTSGKANPSPGDWYYVSFRNTADDATSILENCKVEYAGRGTNGSIYIDNAAPTFDGITVENSGNYDLFYNGTVGGSVSNSTFNSGFSMVANGTVDFSNNTLHQNNAYPIKTYADHVGALTTGITFEDLDTDSHLFIYSGHVTKDATWTAAIPIRTNYDVYVRGTDGDDAVTSLTIEPGAQLRFSRYRGLHVGSSSGQPGALIVQGTADNMIVFTSNEATPAAGNWGGIKFYTTTDAARSMVEYSVIEYAGYNNQGGVYLYQTNPAIRNNTIRNNQSYGLYLYGTGANNAEIQCNTIENNGQGIYATANAAPAVENNNFIANTSYGLNNTSPAVTIAAENNWWGDAQGPNAGGDATNGSVDADPWSTQENQCMTAGENHPPNTPTSPVPEINAVRVSVTGGLNLSWTGGDPDALDTVTYDLYRGASAEALALHVQDLAGTEHHMNDLDQGVTYYWQVVAKDSAGLESTGAVWRFTTDDGPADLSVTNLTADPAGNLQAGQALTFACTVQNGAGPVLEAFNIEFFIDGASIGTHQVDPIVYKGQSVQITQQWIYNGGDPVIEIKADSQGQVTETIETNNDLSVNLLTVIDNGAPDLVGTSPDNGALLQQVQQITATLTDSRSAVDDAAVIAGFTVTDSNQQTVAGNVTKSGDTFTFVPGSGSLPDSTYHVSVTAADTHGNTHTYLFEFTVDGTAPEKPVITGGTTDSGTIAPRPSQNESNQFLVELTGTRDPQTSVWINGTEVVTMGDSAWAVNITLTVGDNAHEIWLKDRAGNQGPSEWVDIAVAGAGKIHFEYDKAGRIKTIYSDQ